MKWRGVEVTALPDAELKAAHDAACVILAELGDEMQRRGMWSKRKKPAKEKPQ